MPENLEAPNLWTLPSRKGELLDVDQQAPSIPEFSAHISLTEVLGEDSSFSGSFTPGEVALVDEARSYDEHVTVIANDIQQKVIEPTIKETTQKLVRRVGGWRNAESGTLWDEIRSGISEDDRIQVFNLLGAVNNEPYTGDSNVEQLLSGINRAVQDDMGIRGPDIVNFNLEPRIRELHEPTSNLEIVEKVQQTAALLTAAGSYKFHRFGRAQFLHSALRFVEECVELEPKFDPLKDRLLDNLSHQLIHSAAAIDVDLKSKPNFQYARPEMIGYRQSLQKMLETLARINARYLLRGPKDISQDVA